MTEYLISFVTYTFAVSGLLILALCIYKKFTTTIQKGSKSDFLRLEHRLDLSARKSIYVIRAGSERFLIASDIDRTSFLAKLNPPMNREQNREMTVPKEMSAQREIKTFDLEEDKIPVLQSLVNKIDERRR